MARARFASPTGVFCRRSKLSKLSRCSPVRLILMLEVRPRIGHPELYDDLNDFRTPSVTSCTKHARSHSPSLRPKPTHRFGTVPSLRPKPSASGLQPFSGPKLPDGLNDQSSLRPKLKPDPTSLRPKPKTAPRRLRPKPKPLPPIFVTSKNKLSSGRHRKAVGLTG
jgi:hypothetical protein